MKMRKKATWDEVIARGERAWHGTTDAHLKHADLVNVPVFGIHGIVVSKLQNGAYHVGLDISGVLCFNASEEEVVSILQRLGALDERWD